MQSNMEMDIKMKKRIKRAAPYMIIGFCSLLILMRCFYSFTWSDESLYLNLVHRFWLGERMIVDEWYTAQLSTPLLLPFYSLYQAATGGNEGVVLVFRIIYWGISSAVTVFLYKNLKKYNSEVAALISSLIYLLYSRANIGGLSYYNMTLTMVMIAIVLIYEGIYEKEIKKQKLLAVGIFLALAVVFNPFLVISYMIIAVCFLIKGKDRQAFMGMIWVGTGILFTAACYLAYVFSKITLRDIIFNIPHILGEPELQRTNPFLVVPLMCARVAWRFRWTISITVLMCIHILFLKKRKARIGSKTIKCVLIVNSIIFLINSVLAFNLIGCINIAYVLLIVPVLILFMEHKENDFSVLYVFGAAGAGLSLAFSFSSDTGLDAMAIGFVPLAMGAVLLVFRLKEVVADRVRYGLFLSMAGIMLLESMFLRICSVYRDAPILELNTRIEKGPGKWLYTTREHAEQYSMLYEAVGNYVREEDKVFYSKECYWGYLCSENEYGVPSSWRMPLNSPRLEEYYKINPDKIPTCVFVIDPEYGKFESSIIQGNEKNDRPNENFLEGFLFDYMMEEHYEVIETACGTIFRSSN